MLAVLFFGKYLKIKLVMTNYAQNQPGSCASTIYQAWPGGGGHVHQYYIPVHHFSPQMCSPFLPQISLIRSGYKCTAKAAPLIDILGANWENLGCPYTSATFFPDTTPFLLSILTSFSPQLYTSLLTCAPALTSLIILDSTLFCAESRTTPQFGTQVSLHSFFL